MPRRGKPLGGAESLETAPRTTTDQSKIVPGGTVGSREQLEAVVASTPRRAPVPTPPTPMSPDEVPNMTDNSNRPDEAITAGLGVGAGPGPEALGMPTITPDDIVRRMYGASPSKNLARLIARSRVGWR